jgi:hypothetical protein
VGLFTLSDEGRAWMVAAVATAAHELGLFTLVAARGPLDAEAIAAALTLPPRRLRPLVDVLAAAHILTRADGKFTVADVPPPLALPPTGWGRLAEVVRRDRPLPDDDALAQFHAHLRAAGAAPARALAETLAALPSAPLGLVDLGGGAGVYSEAFAARLPDAPVTLVDRAPVIALAQPFLDGRATLIAGDLLDDATPLGHGHGVALLANVLHLHGAAACARLVARAAASVAVTGWVVVKDLLVAADRSGPMESLLFAVNMALYTDAGDVHDAERIAAWLAAAGLADITVEPIGDELIVRGRRPAVAAARHQWIVGDGLGDGLARMEASRARARAELAAAGRLRATVDPQPLDPPRALMRVLHEELARDDAHAAAVARHYLELMPRMRVEQLEVSDGPASLFFHAPLDWDALPRLNRAVERLFARLPAGATLVGAHDVAELQARRLTVAQLFAETAYGGFMPLLYGYPADLAYFARALDGNGIAAVIDRYLAAPLIHELTHFGRARDVLSLYLDECIAAWLGVAVMPEFAFPAPGEDNGLYATPWFAQVGQALARVAGADNVIAAQAGLCSWRDALPPGLADALVRLGADDYRATRPQHLLSDTYAPARWMKLCFLAAGGAPVAGVTLAELEALPWRAIPPGPENEDDAIIVGDALRAMCLRNFQIDHSFRVSTRPPPSPITIDLDACVVTTAPGSDGFDGAAPAYLFPPAVAARLRRDGHTRLSFRVDAIAELDALVARIMSGAL